MQEDAHVIRVADRGVVDEYPKSDLQRPVDRIGAVKNSLHEITGWTAAA